MRRGQQPQWIVPDGLWQRIEPLLSTRQRRYRYPGRKRLDGKALCGILFVLRTGVPWELLPQDLLVWLRDDLLGPRGCLLRGP